VIGTVKTAQGEPRLKVHGRYVDTVSIQDLTEANGFEEQVWRFLPKPEGFEHMYNFSNFALQLNYLTDGLRERMAHTDSRLRPDQRALEDGDTDKAI
jgi:oxysterol-binding protein-related protein 3/6/7